MTPNDLQAWQEAMNYTQQQAANALGITRSTYRDFLNGHSRTTKKAIVIDRRTALACTALFRMLPEFSAELVALRQKRNLNDILSAR